MKDKENLDDGDTIIEFQGVNKWFGNFHVLKDIDLNPKTFDLRGYLLSISIASQWFWHD